MRHIWRRFHSMRAQSNASRADSRPWKDAASLIIATPADKTNSTKYPSDYNILFLKRIAKSSFFPNAYVYPGGALDPADKHSRWIEIFQNIDPQFCDNVEKEFFVYQKDGKRSPLFPGDRDALSQGVLPNEIVFRICAIRETFEESGLLLLTNDVQSRRLKPNSVHASSVSHLLTSDIIEKWRNKVHNDANEFINLCIELNKVPDIWSLKEWSEWLTPVLSKNKAGKRYDTVFYSCCLQEKPQYLAHDKVEMSESIWISPAEILRRYLTEDIFLAPPQILETLKLLNFSTIKSLADYMTKRAMKGMRRLMPHFTLTKDGQIIELFPGDKQYPEGPDELIRERDLTTLDQTFEEILNSKNRFCLPAGGDPVDRLASVLCNVELDYDQVGPVTIKDIADLGLNSKL
uniref:nucleoside diphosphate-linked moiety X motif 19-like n=1 Tax=Styela clava TaxID=7725 RepID=UPI0019397AC9|nr:nucleoside diphosphate-linked moiety X motif 19-like [Styela clava]